MALTEQDRLHLARALELAELGRGNVSPNPVVGCVIARDGETIGEGYHAELGALHAERAALADADRQGNDPVRCRRVRDPGAVRAHRQAASLRRRARRGGRGPSCVRSGRSVRESLRQGPGDPQRRRNRGRGRRRRRGAGRAAPEPGVSKARSDGSAARDPQVRGHARRAYGDRVRRLALDLRPGQPRARAPVACRGRRDRDRNRNGAVRRPAADVARSRPAGESPTASRRIRFHRSPPTDLRPDRLAERRAAAGGRGPGRARSSASKPFAPRAPRCWWPRAGGLRGSRQR